MTENLLDPATKGECIPWGKTRSETPQPHCLLPRVDGFLVSADDGGMTLPLLDDEANGDGIFICPDESGNGKGAEAGGGDDGARLAAELSAARVCDVQGGCATNVIIQNIKISIQK